MGRKWTTLLLAMAVFLGMTACGRQETATPNTDRVVVAISSEIETLDPINGWGHGNTPLVQSTLVKYNYDMSFAYDLAAEYGISAEGLKWTFKLRQDAYFTDGEQVTAEDVVFTFQKVKEAGTAADLTFIQSVEAADDFTVVFTLNEPCSVFLNTAASVGIVPAHAYGENYGIAPIGSGPWKFVQLNPQEQLILTANEDYYGDIPAIKDAIIVFMDEDAAFAAVQAGQVDVALTAATLATREFEGYRLARITTVDNRGFTLPVLPDTGETTQKGHPIGNNVTCNLEVRQAIAYALDRELLADVALNGFATPAYSENDGMPWNNPETVIETDVEYAKKLLADAGWVDTDGDGIVEKNGLKAAFHCVYPAGDSVRQALGMAAAQQLKQVGIEVTIEGTSWDDIETKMFSCAVLMGWGASTPSESYYLYQSEGALKYDYYNPEGYMSELTDGYLKAAMNALSVEQAYENWQKAQWDGTTGTAMKGECPWVWMVNVEHLYYVRNSLNIGRQQLHAHGGSYPILQNMHQWVWETA